MLIILTHEGNGCMEATVTPFESATTFFPYGQPSLFWNSFYQISCILSHHLDFGKMQLIKIRNTKLPWNSINLFVCCCFFSVLNLNAANQTAWMVENHSKMQTKSHVSVFLYHIDVSSEMLMQTTCLTEDSTTQKATLDYLWCQKQFEPLDSNTESKRQAAN